MVIFCVKNEKSQKSLKDSAIQEIEKKYATQKIEAEAYVNIKATSVVKFIKKNIIARFGIPKAFITDNGPQFISQQMNELCTKYNIELHHSTPYYPQANGQAEVANKVIIGLIKKHIGNKPRNWHKTLDQILWA